MTIAQVFHRSPTRADRVFYLAGLVAIFVWYVVLVFGREARLDEPSLRTGAHVLAALLVAVASAFKGLAWYPLLAVLPGCDGERAPRAGVLRGLVFVAVVAVGVFVLEPAGNAWLWSTEASASGEAAAVATEPEWSAATSQLPSLVLGALQDRPSARPQLLLHGGSVLLAAGGLMACIGRRRLRIPWWLAPALAFLAPQFAEAVGRQAWRGDGMREFGGNIAGMAIACAAVAAVRALWGAPPSAEAAPERVAPGPQRVLPLTASVLVGVLGGVVLLAHHAHGKPGGWSQILGATRPASSPP